MHNQSLPPADRDDAPEIATPSTAVEISERPGDGRRNERIDGSTVAEATKHLPDSQRSVIRAFHAHYMDNGLTLKEAGQLIDRDNSTLSQIFKGKYPANLDRVVEKMSFFLNLEAKRAEGGKLSFIKTDLSEKMWSIFDLARETQKVAFMIGDTQIGKTTIAERYTHENNHGRTIYTRMPASGSVIEFRLELAAKMRLGKLCAADLNRAIFGAIDSRMLLIIDELSLCMPKGSTGVRRIRVIEFIREIFDRTQCGLACIATSVFAKELESGAFAEVFRQMKRRRLCLHRLPDRPSQKDLNTFADAHGLPPSEGQARELEKRMIDDEALGMWLTVLRLGAKLAASKKQSIGWAHVISAHKGLESLEGKNN